MAPHSPGTDQIDALLWIGFLAAVVVVVAINLALLYAARRFRARRGAEPRPLEGSRRGQLRVASLLSLFALTLFVVGVVFTEKATETPTTGSGGLTSLKEEPLTIKATGQQWLWRYEYPNGAFSYYKLVVPVDTAVQVDLLSTDVVHTWDVPDLAGKRDAVPGKVNSVVFSADEEGHYDGGSATLSGQGYVAMQTEVEVVSPEAYEEFLKSQSAEIETAQNRVVDLMESGETP